MPTTHCRLLPFQMAGQTREEALDWMNKIRETAESASHREDEHRKRQEFTHTQSVYNCHIEMLG